MLRNHVILFFRKAARRKAFAAINTVGLSVSFAGALLIYLYVSNELSFDRFHDNSGRLYRMHAAYAKPGEAVEEFPDTPLNLGPLLAQGFEDIESVTRMTEMSASLLVRAGDKTFNETGIYEVDSSFFHVFTGNIVAGDPDALKHPHMVVLSKSAAVRFFGEPGNAIGQELKVALYGEAAYTVGAVVADFPPNSHLKFNVLMSMDYASEELKPGNWLAHWPLTYVLLREGADVSAVQERLRQTTERILEPIYVERFGQGYQARKKAGGLQEYRFQSITDVHLRSAHMGGAGNITYVYIFAAIGAMLICIASFNYINLSTARSAWEAKGAGIRKVLGASGVQLYIQSITESVLVYLTASIGGLVIAGLVLLSGLPFLQLFIPDKTIPVFTAAMVVAVSCVLGVVTGLAPARLLGTFRPAQVLKGELAQGTKGAGLRRLLVTAQFVVSITLIICTLVIGRQLSFMQSMSLGFDKEHLLAVKNLGTLGDHKATLKDALSNESFVASSTLCNGTVGRPEQGAAFTPVELIEQNRGDVVVGIPIFIGDGDYLKTLGAKLLMGHSFPDGLPKANQQIILNEEALRAVGWQDRSEKDVIGKMIDVNGRRYELAGIVENYNYSSLRSKIEPMAIVSHYWQSYEMLLVRLKPGTTAQAIRSIQEKWDKIAGGVPFSYSFVDQDLDRLYSSEQNMAILFMTFASLAVFVGCLGLFGLAIFAAERSVKEIGIRKVLGASVAGIVIRLSRSMVFLVLLAFALATPVAWYTMHQWLENFAYRQPMGIAVFAIAGSTTLIITILTIGYQATKAALANPVDSLRSE